MKKLKAFTLVEILLVLTIFMVLLGYTVPRMANSLFANQVEVAGQELVHVLRRANIQASSQVHDSDWGVYFNSVASTYTFFAGSTYGEDSSFDLIYVLPSSITFDFLSMGDEVVFHQITGDTDEDGSIVILAGNGETRTITVNTLGNVSSD
jgi:type II secretory pathway pseudopilin PulG